MIGYRVSHRDEMIEQLKSNDVERETGSAHYEREKFAWVMEPDSNKVERWELMLWVDKNKQQ